MESLAASENHVYELSRIIVYGDKKETINQKNVLTGGAVDIISKSEIERRHFTDVKELLMAIPGVTVEDPGYRAQA